MDHDKTLVDMKVFHAMINRNMIPREGTFEVTENLIDEFNKIYNEIIPGRQKVRNKPVTIRYTKKLAGLSLMKLNINRSTKIEFVNKLKVTKPKCGLLYLVSNPAFPGMYKIGITRDLNKRLSQYQTGDPFRKYKVEHYKFVEDSKLEEKLLLTKYKMDVVKGEWVSTDKIKDVFLF